MFDNVKKTPLSDRLLKPGAPDAEHALPFVSVVTPTYNRAAFLPYLLYMFRYQDYPAARRELIILDDSAQSHAPLIDAMTHGQPERCNIRYIHHPQRLALGNKRNMLNELAQGEYILCMDDDDYYPPDKISYTIAMMRRHRALISGADQIPIWYSHIDRMFKTASFGARHILNGTFCYHRNYLKKHRYDDACNLGEEAAFTNGFRVTPLQLPGERAILCISHSHNTFDKDFVLGSSIAMPLALTDAVVDPLLRTWYRSLHDATHQYPIAWGLVDKVVVVNLDRRPDRWRRMQQILTQLNAPAEKIVRFSAQEDADGRLGRRDSHLAVLQSAQRQGWRNYLLLEDDAEFLRQEKHVNALNRLLDALAHIAWQVVLLGGQVHQGRELNSLAGIVQAHDCQKVCAYLVNHPYYPTLAAQMAQDPSVTPEEQWQPLLRRDKWLACYPSLCYQRAGFSDIEGRETDNVRYYFNRINKNHLQEVLQSRQPPIANQLGAKIGFYLETAFHYQVYRPIIDSLLAAGYACDLLISDLVPPALLDEMKALLREIDDRRLSGSRLSEVKNRRQRYACLVSPYYTPQLNGLARIQVRAMYGLAKERWNHAWWNVFYHHILCYGPYSQAALNIHGSASVVGNPRFDDWHNQRYAARLPDDLKLNARKPTLLYAPTFGDLSSLPHWAAQLARLSQDYNLIVKLHHGTAYRPDEQEALGVAKRYLKKRVADARLTLPLLAVADYVLTDNSGFIFDAIHAGKRTILLNWPGMAQLLQEEKTYSSPHSADQKIRAVLPVADDMAQLRRLLSPDYDWAKLEQPLAEIRRHYCDPFQDGCAGQRAAQVIIDALSSPDDAPENTLLLSLQQKLFV